MRRLLSPNRLNIFDPQWEEVRDEPRGFKAKRTYLARTLGAERRVCRVCGGGTKPAPKAGILPYHAHHANEELLVVLTGTPTLRTLDTERELADGVPFFSSQAHRLHQSLVRVHSLSLPCSAEPSRGNRVTGHRSDSGVCGQTNQWKGQLHPIRAPDRGRGRPELHCGRARAGSIVTGPVGREPNEHSRSDTRRQPPRRAVFRCLTVRPSREQPVRQGLQAPWLRLTDCPR